MKHTLTLLILTVLVAVAHPSGEQAQRSLSYEPAPVELEGRLVIQLKYGPPNFGEQPKTDKKLRVPVLILNDPVNVVANEGDADNAESVNGVTQVQLVFLGNETAYKKLIGKSVHVTGTLFHGHTGHHFTDVLMKVRSIESKGGTTERNKKVVP